MLYIEVKPKENGAHANLCVSAPIVVPDGYAIVSKELEENAFALLPWVKLTLDSDVVVAIEDDVTARKAWEATQITTPDEARKSAYATLACISWEGEQITVDSANTLWVAYSAEGSTIASQLSTLIEAAKQKIRAMYPDTTA